jgi:peroxiredoxin
MAADPAPDSKTGLKIGEKARDFKLKDQAGREHSLTELLKTKPVAIVFYRLASW